MRKLALTSFIALAVMGCSEVATIGATTISTGQVPGTLARYRVEKYNKPTDVDGLLATHAIFSPLLEVSPFYFDFYPGSVGYYRDLMPQVCAAEGKRLIDVALSPTIVGKHGRIGFRCGEA